MGLIDFRTLKIHKQVVNDRTSSLRDLIQDLNNSPELEVFLSYSEKSVCIGKLASRQVENG